MATGFLAESHQGEILQSVHEIFSVKSAVEVHIPHKHAEHRLVIKDTVRAKCKAPSGSAYRHRILHFIQVIQAGDDEAGQQRACFKRFCIPA